MIPFNRQMPVWILPLDRSDPNHPKAGEAAAVQGLTDIAQPVLSPDGHWIAYAARDASLVRRDIYVEPFPRNGAKRRLSETGGNSPTWSGNGSEIFVESISENGIMSVSYRVDGNRFAAEKARLRVPYDGGAHRMTFLLNFGDELQRRLARGNRARARGRPEHRGKGCGCWFAR